MSKNVLGGQCSNCVHAPTCTYVECLPRRVFQCDEFSPIGPVEVENPRAIPTVAAEDCGEVASAKLNGARGLCRDCELWETCEFSHPEAGVWHCDEYQ
jgi:hypothetical protein